MRLTDRISLLIALAADQNPLYAVQTAAPDSDSLADFDERVREHRNLAREQWADRLDLVHRYQSRLSIKRDES
jgi:hypothetical protein